MTTSRERIHVMERPHGWPSLGHGAKEGRVVHKSCNPVKVDDVTIRQLRRQAAVFRPIVAKQLSARRARTTISVELSFNKKLSDATTDPAAEIPGSTDSGHGRVVAPAILHDHAGILSNTE
jgi:hypothetical protein